MFERYTEKARRVIFFARYEAREFGSEFIEPDFLLLGIARENPEFCGRWLGVYYVQLRQQIAPMYWTKKRIATSVDLPLSNTSKRVLAYAAEEADRLGDRHIGTEHLFLGLLREGCVASKMLKERHEDLKSVRVAISKDPDRPEMKAARSSSASRGLQMRVLEEGGGEVAVIPWQGWTPRIGEAIRIPVAEIGETTYRILDLCWRSYMRRLPLCGILKFCLRCAKNCLRIEIRISLPAFPENLKK
ncbi:MAG: Clp protease N-terminal domain-containing protein [Acidobacteriaceae bacterium]